MNLRRTAIFVFILLGSRVSHADASYQETSQITGGTMVQALQSVSFIKSVKNMFAPITTVTMVHGSQKAVVGKDSTEITDLDRETITRIDNVRKTYTVTTFAQMRQAIANVPKQMEQAQTQMKQEQPEQPKSNIQTSFDVSVKNTGATREINGLTAQEQLITMQMHATDPNAPASEAGNSVTYVVTTDAWIAVDPPEVKEIQEFDQRMAKQLMAGVDVKAFQTQMSQNAGMAQLLGSKPGSAEAMAQMQKEIAKLKGTRVLEVTRMGGSGTGTAGPATAQATQGTAPAAGSSNVVGDVATETAAQTAASEASRMGVLGSALGSSALGAFHRKKAAAPAAAPAAATPAVATSDGPQAANSVVLMEMTLQKSNFSQQGVPASAFMVPAGYQQVQTAAYSGGK